MFGPFLAVSAIFPSLMLVWFIRRRDLNPEPGRVIWATFALGVLTVFPVLLVDAPISAMLGHPSDPYAQGFGEAFLVAGFPEEGFKFLVVWLYCSRHREFDEPMDGIVYGAVASLGFATFENVLYVTSGGLGTAIMRAVTAVPGHACFGIVMGYFVGQAKFRPAERTSLMVRGYLSAVLLHGLYDAGLLTSKAMSGTGYDAENALMLLLSVAVLIVMAVIAIRLIRRMTREQREMAAQFAWHAQQQWAAQQQQGPYAGGYAEPAQATPWSPPVAPPPVMQAWPAPAPFVPITQGPRTYEAPPSTGVAWLQIVFGGLLASGGGLMSLGGVVAIAQGQGGDNLWGLVVASLLLGVLPVMIGIALFGFGMRRLALRRATQAMAVVAPMVAPPAQWPR